MRRKDGTRGHAESSSQRRPIAAHTALPMSSGALQQLVDDVVHRDMIERRAGIINQSLELSALTERTDRRDGERADVDESGVESSVVMLGEHDEKGAAPPPICTTPTLISAHQWVAVAHAWCTIIDEA